MRVFALLLLAALTGLGCSAKPLYRTPDAAPETRGPASPRTKQIEEIARPWMGTPYRYGGGGDGGIDCSAFSSRVLRGLGVSLPRTVRAQREVGQRVDRRRIVPGDLVFFRLESGSTNHVGVVLDRERFVHASTSRGVVVDRIYDKYFESRFVEARRVLEE